MNQNKIEGGIVEQASSVLDSLFSRQVSEAELCGESIRVGSHVTLYIPDSPRPGDMDTIKTKIGGIRTTSDGGLTQIYIYNSFGIGYWLNTYRIMDIDVHTY